MKARPVQSSCKAVSGAHLPSRLLVLHVAGKLGTCAHPPCCASGCSALPPSWSGMCRQQHSAGRPPSDARWARSCSTSCHSRKTSGCSARSAGEHALPSCSPYHPQAECGHAMAGACGWRYVTRASPLPGGPHACRLAGASHSRALTCPCACSKLYHYEGVAPRLHSIHAVARAHCVMPVDKPQIAPFKTVRST